MIDFRDEYYIRAGIIPFYRSTGEIYMGRDSDYGTLIDLGGTREQWDDDIVDTARRECFEESLGLLKFSREDLLNDSIIIRSRKLYDNHNQEAGMITFFVDIKLPLTGIEKIYLEYAGNELNKGNKVEISSIQKLDSFAISNQQKIYPPLINVLEKMKIFLFRNKEIL